MGYDYLWDIASHYYKTSGENQLPHIKRVYRHAEFLVGRELSLSEAVAVIFHDFTKSMGYDMPHGFSASLALPSVLRKHGLKLAVDGDLYQVMEAIGYHDDDSIESPSDLADLLRSADALPPNLGMYLYKAFNKSLKGRTPEEAYTRVLKAVRSGRPLMEHMKYKPRLYFKVYAQEVETLKYDMAECQTPADVKRFISEYLDSHPDANPEV